MKKPWSILCASLLLGCSDPASDTRSGSASPPRERESAQSPAPDPDPPAEERPPAILFDGAAHDFGAVLDVEDLRHSFSFMNTGDRPLVLGELKPSCGCTALELDRDEYGPGEVGAIDVVWDTIGWGRQQKTIEVHSNADGQPMTLLTIAATIEPFVRTEPALLDFGASDNTEERRLRFELRCLDPNFQIESVGSPLAEIGLFVLEPPRDGRAVLEAVRSPTNRVGTFLPALEVVVVGRPDGYAEDVRHRAEVKTRANLYRELLVEPALVSVGRVPPGGPVECRVRVSRPKGGPFNLLAARVEGAATEELQVAVEPAGPAESFELVVTGPIGAVEGPVRGTLVLETDLAGEPSRSVPVMGMVAR